MQRFSAQRSIFLNVGSSTPQPPSVGLTARKIYNLREYGLVTGSTGKGKKREKREEKGEEKEGFFR